MHDDLLPKPKPVTANEANASFREQFNEFVKFTARELVELVSEKDPTIGGRYQELKQKGIDIDPRIYITIHRLLTSGTGFSDRIMEEVSKILSIRTLSL